LFIIFGDLKHDGRVQLLKIEIMRYKKMKFYHAIKKNVIVHMRYFKDFFFYLMLIVPLLTLEACSTNPATGRQSFTAFMSVEKEKEVGATEHPKIVERFGGIYQNKSLGFYVARIGLKLTQFSELPNLEYTFTILNDEKVNAFALPGGYVYVTRGLLAIVANEAEMAGVLAHEIGHITARHSSQRHSVTKAANIGLQILGAIGSIAGAPTGTSQLASLGGKVALKSYSREQELEADMLGVRYLTRAGYDPDAMTSFFHKLKAHSKLIAAMRGNRDQSERINIMSTHPLTSERIAKAEKLVAQTKVTSTEHGKDAYAKEIDGLVFGDDPEQGIRRGQTFEHPALGIRFEVPPDFTMINSPRKLTAKSGNGSVILFDMAPVDKIHEIGGITDYIKAINFKGRKFQNVKNLKINGMAGVTGFIRLTRAGIQRDVRILVIKKKKNQIFRMLFESDTKNKVSMALKFKQTISSFKSLNQAEILAIKPLRIRFKEVLMDDNVEKIARGMPIHNFALEWFELLNKTERGTPLKTGQRVRVVGY
jgi:predicted Zn-dependent protease